MKHAPILTFAHRTEPCPDCDMGWQDSDAYGDERCDECDGTGLTAKLCEMCEGEEKLTADGLCANCTADLAECPEAAAEANEALAPRRAA
jgi:hypothetical protein